MAFLLFCARFFVLKKEPVVVVRHRSKIRCRSIFPATFIYMNHFSYENAFI